MLIKILKLFTKKELYFFFSLVGILIFSALLEVFAVSLIPLYVKILSEPNFEPQFFKIIFFKSYINDFEKIIFFSAFIIIVFLLKNIFQFFINFYNNNFLRNFLVRLSSSLFNIYLKKNYMFFIKNNSSKLIRNLTSEIEQAGNLVNSSIQIFKEGIILVGLFILIIFFQTIYVFILLFFFSIIVYLFYLFFKKRVTQSSYKLQFLKSEQIKAVNHTINTFSSIKILNLEEYYKKIYLNLINDYEKHKFFKNIIVSSPRLFLEFLSVTLIICVSCLLIINTEDNKSIIYQLSLLAVASIRILPAYNSISSSLVSVRYNMASLKLLLTYSKDFSIQEKSTFNNFDRINYNSAKKKKNNKISKNFLLIRNISYKYPNTKNLIIKNLSLKLNFGEILGVVGETGSGKSTFINLILGFLHPISGSILHNEKNININIRAWHSKIGYIPQENLLIDDTIKKNIALGLNSREIDNDKIYDLLKKLKFSNNEKNLKNLINFRVGEFGKKLSGGQKQRLAIARAMYRDPEVLILDEATSSLDIKTEKEIMNLIYKLKKEKVIILISHKLNILKYCDKVIRINKIN